MILTPGMVTVGGERAVRMTAAEEAAAPKAPLSQTVSPPSAVGPYVTRLSYSWRLGDEPLGKG
ncbi:MAG: hypothetical protein AB7M12_08140 [Hyphomonadaceae bacterium]